MSQPVAAGAAPAPQNPIPASSPSTSGSALAVESPDDRASSFRAVKGGGETVAGGKLMIAAYAVVWVIVLMAVVRIFLRQNKVASHLEALEDAIRKSNPKGPRS